jgi:hypothetical protein
MGPKSHKDDLKRRSGPRCVMKIIEADKFDVELDSIRVSMRFLQPTQEAGQKYGTDPSQIRVGLELGVFWT